jgi:two-component system, NarL family, response regulator LiaR
MTMNTIRVMIVDDHPLMRKALRMAIEAEGHMEVAAEAGNGQVALDLEPEINPDVILMDLYMPVMDGIEATARIMKANPSARILAITSSDEDEKVLAAIRAGALGYLLKDTTQDRLVEGIRTIAEGKRYIPAEIAEKLARGLHNENQNVSPLTRRETEILALIGEGLSNSEIAKRLFLSNSTVRVHVFNILDKLELSDRNQAILFATRNHIVSKSE